MAGDERLSASSRLWRNTDGTSSRIAGWKVTLAGAPFLELPGGEGGVSLDAGHGASELGRQAARQPRIRRGFYSPVLVPLWPAGIPSGSLI